MHPTLRQNELRAADREAGRNSFGDIYAVFFENHSGDDRFVHFIGAIINARGALVPVPMRKQGVIGEAQATMMLRPRTGGADMELSARIENADMARMNDLVRNYGGVNVAAGEFSVFTELKVTNGGSGLPAGADLQLASAWIAIF